LGREGLRGGGVAAGKGREGSDLGLWKGKGKRERLEGEGGLAAEKEGLRRVAVAGKGRLEGGEVGNLGFWEREEEK